MKQALYTAIACLALVTFAGCSKDDGGSSKSRTELITQSSWKYESAGIDADRNGIVDSPLPPGMIDPCEMDNLITFNANGSGLVDEGPTKCNGGSPQTVPFSWSLKDNEQTIVFSGMSFGGLNGDVKLKNISDRQMELHKDVNIGMVVNVIVFLKR